MFTARISQRLISASYGALVETRRSVLMNLGESTFGYELLKTAPAADFQQKRFKVRDLKVDFTFKRERPVGPHKHKTPNLIDPRASREIDYRRIVHYPEDGKYTIKKLKMTKLGGRHPVTGRKVIEGVGGGSKRKYRWIDFHRLPQVIIFSGYGTHLRYQIATKNMKQGDLIRTFTDIPDNPIRPKEGDSHPLGALPIGTAICQIEAWPGEGAFFMKNAEDEAKIVRKVGDRVVIKCWDKLEFAIPQEAQCVIGANSIHPLRAMPIGSPNRMRWLGRRPRSGLWKRKGGRMRRKINKIITSILGSPNRMRWLGRRPRSGLWKRKGGRMGRKIKKPPPTTNTTPYAEFMKDVGTPSNRPVRGRSVLLTAKGEGRKGRTPASKRLCPDGW
ncbi:LOW QUALITY PROTEIN: 39S ribosomal protein L2, mitochondrial-like [Eurytemora carolleeae]|uniref:LOW QUALITY PROTEIN: 39S ribosomal protein L2, mitochondrial-like n=1 Tax=Eurytemora carolleeae TaxID=1294199 RepID=UPI000C761DED|nr:LOW QUALITY PROTEIN: 39S ribosomal protein L2, mitochondrial-like [Eurytemora carolleeae]|eukprot:XP_023327583.1 LOW QUALITY PROTEIN: 39S ribosomal protein L2, mitochondrial-like [Eurytemora affinis]